MAFRDGDTTPEAMAGAMAVCEAMSYIQVLAKAWGAK